MCIYIYIYIYTYLYIYIYIYIYSLILAPILIQVAYAGHKHTQFKMIEKQSYGNDCSS